MHKILQLLIPLILFACQSTTPIAVAPPELAGDITAATLWQNAPQFAKNYQDYQPSGEELEAISKIAGKSLVVMFGTWCHDSRREVPRLLKLIDLSGVKLVSLQLVAVNRQKQESSGLYRQLALRYTPTIVLMDGQTELGRIVEQPQVSLAADLAAMLPSS